MPTIQTGDTPTPAAPAERPEAEVLEYHQNVDSFGWSILALFKARYGRKDKDGGEVYRWGILDILTGTENGEGYPTDKGTPRTQLEVVAAEWNLIDWFYTEEEAKSAFMEAQSRKW